MLGGAGSGKSTFIKQLRLRHGDGYPDSERLKLLPGIYENLTDGLNVLLDCMEHLKVSFEKQENKVGELHH